MYGHASGVLAVSYVGSAKTSLSIAVVTEVAGFEASRLRGNTTATSTTSELDVEACVKLFALNGKGCLGCLDTPMSFV